MKVTETDSHESLRERALRDAATAAARGDAPFDLLLSGGLVADMVTGETREADVGIVGPMIASVHERGTRADARHVEAVDGATVVPGLIDAHMHVESSMVTPEEYSAAVLCRGVTTVVWDPHELGNSCGLDGVRYALAAAENLPLRILTLAPSCVPSAPGLESSGADFTPEVVEEILSWPGIHGLAEVMEMKGVIERSERMAAIVQAGLESGKRVCGHARGLAGSDLNAYVTSGVVTDHELTSGADLVEKLRSGITVELRGSHDHLLPEFVEALKGLGRVPETVTLCTDDVFPDDLLEGGGLDDVARRLVGYGMEPMDALRCATFNAANRIGRDDLGLVAPGRRADLAVFEDLTELKALQVYVDGECVAKDGSMLVDLAVTNRPSVMDATMKVDAFAEDDFRVRASGKTVLIDTIDWPRFTKWGSVEATVREGHAALPPGCTLMAVANRYGSGSAPQVAMLKHWGEWKGAFATTVSHDSHNLTVFGGNEGDMALAANTVVSQGGGLAVASAGKVLASLPLPLAGLISGLSLDEVAKGFAQVRTAMDKVVEWQPPYLVFKACFGASLACNEGPHLTDLGIVDRSRPANRRFF